MYGGINRRYLIFQQQRQNVTPLARACLAMVLLGSSASKALTLPSRYPSAGHVFVHEFDAQDGQGEPTTPNSAIQLPSCIPSGPQEIKVREAGGVVGDVECAVAVGGSQFGD
ncbi:hypothetical protein BC938DRAFT_480233 [Jimgerdemannia flammicorona]|uniref:Uncharacterized protein n=1 Tax=Jimgerdemannia flammicorona TaxID=994334 RepID=A0A433QIZ0_9FUNG|nr:hypothetical protein BC938DRAFT_480233 [Jimgerdemannia flammicorona]